MKFGVDTLHVFSCQNNYGTILELDCYGIYTSSTSGTSCVLGNRKGCEKICQRRLK